MFFSDHFSRLSSFTASLVPMDWKTCTITISRITAITMVGYDFDACIALCREKAAEGGCVLLSPACASFDMFKDYEDRGRIFKEKVMALR